MLKCTEYIDSTLTDEKVDKREVLLSSLNI